MHRVEELLRTAGRPKLNLQIRVSNFEAVRSNQLLGYGRDEVFSYGRRLIPD